MERGTGVGRQWAAPKPSEEWVLPHSSHDLSKVRNHCYCQRSCSYHSCTLMLGEREIRVHRAVLFWGRAFPSCHNSSRKQTQTATASAPSHHFNMRNTQGTHRSRLPPCLLPASSCSLSHAPRSIGPLQAALAGMTMASLPHGNIHPEHPALIFLPSPKNAKAWGRKILPWGRSIPTS